MDIRFLGLSGWISFIWDEISHVLNHRECIMLVLAQTSHLIDDL